MTTKKKKLYLLVVALGGAALLVDRLLPAPVVGPAMAEAASKLLVGGGRAATAVPVAAATSIPMLHFPKELPVFDPAGAVRDLFAPPPSFLPTPTPAGPTPYNQPPSGDLNAGPGLEPAAQTGLMLAAADFPTQHQLMGVISHDGDQVAIVSNRWVRPGESVDGCTLSEVHGRQAIFECYDGQVTLELFEESRKIGG